VHLRRKTKGNFGICGVLSLLGKIKRKLDRVFVGPALKPNRRRKRVRVLGLSNSSGGWALGSALKSVSGLCAIPGRDSGSGPNSLMGSYLEPDLGETPPLVLSKGTFMGSEEGIEVPSSSIVGVVSSSCSGVLVSSVSAPSSLVFVRESAAEGFAVKAKVPEDSPAKGSTPAGDGFGNGNGSDDVALMPVPVSPFPSAEDFPASFLSRDWEDLFSSTPAKRLGVSLKEVFAVPWEVDEPVSPPCRDYEVTSSGAEDIQVDEPVRSSAPAKSLIRRGFFGPRAAPPPPVVLKEVSPVRKGKDPIPEVGSSSVAAVQPSSQVSPFFNGTAVKETRRESGIPTNSFVSLSQLWYTRRVKEKVAKQLNKNKDLIAEVVGVIPVVEEDRVANALNLTPVLGLSWGGEDKKLRDLVS
jgi:hypothetical protein